MNWTPTDEARAAEIRDLLSGLGAARERPPGELARGDALDQAVAAAERAAAVVPAVRARFERVSRRLDALMEHVVALASFDYGKEARVEGDGEALLDGFAAGLNDVGRALASSTVSKAYVNDVIESMSDMLVVTGEDGGIKTVNEAVCAATGYARAELDGMPLEALIDVDGARAVIEAGGLRGASRRCRAADGRRIAVSFSASVLRGRGAGVEGLVCVARDLTESQRLDDERWRLREAVRRQAILVEELSIPLVSISADVLVVPIVGTLDEARAHRMTEALVRGIAARRARTAIVDVTGVRAIDLRAAEGIARAVQSVRLLGAEVQITGVGPEVATTLVQLGVGLRGVAAFGSLQRGIRHALKQGARKRG